MKNRWFRSFNSERKKLIASLSLNFLSRIPAIGVPLIALPLVSNGLGLADYALLLASLAAGTLPTILFSGTNTALRRRITKSVSQGDVTEQGYAVADGLAIGMIVFSISSVLVFAAFSIFYGINKYSIIALLPIFSSVLNVFDNIRASFNEHYVTAGIQLVFHLLILAIMIIVGIPDSSPFWSALLLIGPYPWASFVGALLLFRARPHLFRSLPSRLRIRFQVSDALGAVATDGIVLLSASLIVFLLPRFASAEVAAWFGSVYRVFLILLSPVMLFALPLCTFLGGKWWILDRAQRVLINFYALLASIIYGAICTLAIGTLVQIYVRDYLKTSPPSSDTAIIIVSFGLASIAAHKLYSLFVLSFGSSHSLMVVTTLSVGFAVLTGSAALVMGVDSGLEAYCMLLGLGLSAAVAMGARELSSTIRADCRE